MLTILSNLKKYWKVILALLFAAFVALKVHGCDKKKMAPQSATKTVALPKDDKEIINVQSNKVTITTDKGTQTVTGSRDTKIEVQKDGTVKVTEKTLGFEHQIGGNIYGGKEGLGVGLDLRFAYYKDFDALTGLGYLPHTQHLDIWLGGSYTIHNSWVSNTAVFAGWSIMSHTPIAGASLRF